MRHGAHAAILLASALFSSPAVLAQGFTQTNLVSDLAGQALHQDANLVNPWGLVPGASGVFWAANNVSGTSTLYDPDGTVRSLVVTIPGGSPTGIVVAAAGDSSFRIPSADTTARAVFIFVTQAGTVAAWSPNVNTTSAIQVATVTGAEYTGAALGGTQAEPRLYAANFAAAKIDVFNRDFATVTPTGTFTDPTLPAGYSPFNIANIGGQLFVAYAQRDPATGDEVPGAGLGYVSVYDMNGTFLRRFASGSPLNAPWGIVHAPAGFGDFGGSVLVGNFGDGRIDAFDLGTGAFQAALADTFGNPVAIQGLWGLSFGLPVSGPEVAQRLYFAAGIEDETHGLFGFLAEADTVIGPGGVVCENDSKGPGWWRNACGGPSTGKGKGKGDEHRGPKPGIPSDSLATLFGCISSASAPNAFGTGGCFTAGCDLLQKVGQRTVHEFAAQALLIARLNLCSGRLCDTTLVGCIGMPDSVRMLTVGEVADSLDALLCSGASDSTLRSLTGILRCLDGDDDENGEGDDGSNRSAQVQTIGIRTIGGNPAHLGASPISFAVTTTEPTFVRLRIYDALGRMVAEPLHGSMVSGSVEVTWDHRDSGGRLVAPGSYFYRATGGAHATTGRIVILR